jgi:thiomorpholine-carboxylate dehydrogenase
MQILDQAAVAARLDYPALIDRMEQALIAFSKGEVVQPVRQFVPVEEHDGFFGMMPAVSDAMGVKITFYPENQEKGIHTHHALILLFDPTTGEPTAVMDGGLITEKRTAATSAAATRLLATEDASVLAVLGSGVQARAHIEAMRLIRPIEEIRIWSRNPEHAARLATEVGATTMPPEEAVRGADIVVTATAASEPILEGAWLDEGAHVNAVGWNGSDGRELDDAVMGNLLFVESLEAAQDQAGNVRGSGAAITAEIGAALANPDPQWRDRTTVFDSVGMAIEDVAAAQLVLESGTGSDAA